MNTEKIIVNTVAVIVLFVTLGVLALTAYDIAYGERKPPVQSNKPIKCEIRGYKGNCVKWS